MSQQQTEKRKYQRVFFAPASRLSADFEQPGITAVVLDISLGGMGASIKRTNGQKFKKNDRIRLCTIKGRDGLEINAGFEIEIRWIIDQPGFEHIAFGCRFLDPPQAFMGDIGSVVERALGKHTM
ncbi:MAG: PilZ domain-containing protein [Deltaproteobacteria bacterium]|nr:PilZ domain-containing protein [Deltaproteobacteria bacterium]